MSQAIDPLPAWDSPLDGEPLGAVLYEQDNPRALIADPATRRAWKVSILPRRVP